MPVHIRPAIRIAMPRAASFDLRRRRLLRSLAIAVTAITAVLAVLLVATGSVLLGLPEARSDPALAFQFWVGCAVGHAHNSQVSPSPEARVGCLICRRRLPGTTDALETGEAKSFHQVNHVIA